MSETTEYAILLKMLLDEASQARVDSGLSTSEKELEAIEIRASKTSKELLAMGYTGETAAKRIRKEFEQNTKANFFPRGAGPGAAPSGNDAAQQAAAEKQAAQAGNLLQRHSAMRDILAEENKQEDDIVRAVREQVKAEEAAKQAAQDKLDIADANLDAAKANLDVVRQQREEWAQLRDVSEQVGQKSQAVFVAGAGILGGIFAAAQKYVSAAKESNQVTRAWGAATNSLEKSGSRVGAVMAREALPLLRQVAQLADKAAGFVEANPGIVQAALNTGLVLAGLGAVGIAVSKGIRLYADIGYIGATLAQMNAAKLMKAASAEQLAAAAGMKLGGAGGVAGAGAEVAAAGLAASATALIPVVAAIAAAVLGGLVVGAVISALIAKAQGRDLSKEVTGGAYVVGQQFGKMAGLSQEETDRKAIVFAAIIGKLTGAIDKSSPLWLRAASSIKKAGADVSDVLTNLVAQSKQKDAIIDAWAKYQDADKAATKKWADDRLKIVQDANAAEVKQELDNSKAIAAINQQLASQIQSILSNSRQADIAAEKAYATSRSQAIRDANLEIERIEQDHKERLRQLEKEHNDNVKSLSDSRDALGLAREMRRFSDAKSEEQHSTDEEIARRRADLALRLADMDAAYVAEREQRAAQTAAQLEEAKKQAEEALKQQAIANQDALLQIAEQKAKELALADQAHTNELTQNRNNFVEQMNQLDSALLGEAEIRQRHYDQMLADVDAWAAEYRKRLAGAGGAPPPQIPPLHAHDYTGYAYKGAYAMAQNGQREFVLNGSATRAAEMMLGGSLNQYNLLGAVAGGNSSSQMAYHDNRTFSGDVSPNLRREIAADTERILREMLR